MNNHAEKKFSYFLGESALLFMTLIWGGTFVVVKESLSDISSMLFITIRFIIASIVIVFVLIVKNHKINKQDFFAGILLGIFLFLGFIFQTAGLKYTTASKSGFITGSLVVIVPFLQFFIEKKVPTKGAVIGTILVFIGIVFLSSSGTSISDFIKELGSNFNFGDTLTLICALFFALHVVYMDIISPKHDFWVLFVSQLISVAILSFFVSIFFHILSIETVKIKFTNNLLIGILYTSLLATCVNFGLQTKFQKLVSPTKAAIIYSFEPIFAAIFAFFILKEKFSNFGLLGSFLIFTGLIISEIFDSFSSKFLKS
ncbi:MAG: DMT family transporter [Melioribacter sp.]|nr:DMT family transporter [Melioribacter sp.]